MIEVYKPGSYVKIGYTPSPITARVIYVTISDNDYVQYRVLWWSGETRYEMVVEHFEVRPGEVKETIPIGFKPNAK